MDLPPVGTPPPAYGGAGYGQPPMKHSLIERLQGVVTFKAPIYREIAEDQDATMTAGIILVVVSLITGLLSGLLQGGQIVAQLSDPALQGDLEAAGIETATIARIGFIGFALVIFIITPIFALLGWLIGSWLYATVAKMFGGNTDTGEMLRISGHIAPFNLLGVIPCVGIVGFILTLVGTAIGVREAAFPNREDGLTKSILTMVVVFLIYLLIIGVLIGCIVFGIVALASAAAGASG